MNNGHQYILSLFERCKSMRELKQLHGHMITTAQIRYVIPSSRLIDFCANSESGDLDYASSLFSRFDRPTIFMWNSIIRGLSHANDPDRALSMYRQMLQLGHSPDHFTFPFVLRACAMNHDRDYGKCVHCRIVKSGFESDLYASSCLIHMYVSSADLEAGKLVFDKMPHRNVVAWTTLIAGLVSNDQAGEALRVFKLMELAGVQPNEVTMVNVLAACAQMRDLETGRWAHSHLCRIGIDPIPSNPNQNCRPNVILATAILDIIQSLKVYSLKIFNLSSSKVRLFTVKSSLQGMHGSRRKEGGHNLKNGGSAVRSLLPNNPGIQGQTNLTEPQKGQPQIHLSIDLINLIDRKQGEFLWLHIITGFL
ncbi:hypothetical protein AAC387_Pa03g4031 [Persea americana]